MSHLLTIVLTVVIFALGLAGWWFRKRSAGLQTELVGAKDEVQRLRTRFEHILDADAEYAKVKESTDRAKREHHEFLSGAEKRRAEISKEYESARATYDALKREVSLLEENLEDISFGLYKPHFTFQTSDEYREKLEAIRDEERRLIRDRRAAFCAVQWNVQGSEKEGARMTKQYTKVILRAFNGECDAAVANVSWNNITRMEERLRRSFEAINELGSVMKMAITPEFLQLKIDELRLTHEFEEKKQREREEQRRIREQIRDEEKAQREIENAREEAEEEESRSQKALQKARAEAAAATGAQLEKLSEQIRSLEAKITEAQEQKERAISRAQLTKSGFVYVISNIGSFGEGVMKVGMTRRLEPIERIEELGDASVPFPFDVHAMLYSDNAPELENALHEFLDSRRINLVNPRKEFYFGVALEEIEKFTKERGLSAQFTKIAEAKEYRETLSNRQAMQLKSQGQPPDSSAVREAAKFPQRLFGADSGPGGSA